MTTYYSRASPKLEPETACSGIECTLAGTIDHLLVFLWLGALGIVVAALWYVPRALEACDEEYDRTREEAQAFDRFARRVAEIDVSSPREQPTQQALAGAVTASFATSSNDRALRDVRETYRETVMSVSHYREEYDEPLAENVAEEFDETVATVLTDGGQWTPEVKRLVVARATEARNRRERFLEVLERETDALESATDSFERVEATLESINDRPSLDYSYEELEDAWDELRELERRTDTQLTSRQEAIQGSETVGRQFTDPWTMYAYLYRSLSTSHPILTDGTRLLEKVTTTKHRIVRALTSRV
ncbi:hypothetical protein ACFOZ7_03960 [Natribaculum luteum]|uniref:DUF7260 domain-containing protein n=1 Tax=Natribaculum luteum TaxID=1586232 RepID=A0ABD5NWI8_9EURY|nr:hypothetical protein [Natribaculum luteum]